MPSYAQAPLSEYQREKGKQEDIGCKMGDHGGLQPFLPEKPSENDPSYAVQDDRPGYDERGQCRHGCRDGQVSQAEYDSREED